MISENTALTEQKQQQPPDPSDTKLDPEADEDQQLRGEQFGEGVQLKEEKAPPTPELALAGTRDSKYGESDQKTDLEHDLSNFDTHSVNPPSDLTTTIQPFQMCPRRLEWDEKYGSHFKLDLAEEKKKIFEKKKPPRKPLSPYIFFSQEKRKEIKKQRKDLSAKQIMKMVSKSWQDIRESPDCRELTEKFEYLSIRDREVFSLLKEYWDDIKFANDLEKAHDDTSDRAGSFSYSDKRRLSRHACTSKPEKIKVPAK